MLQDIYVAGYPFGMGISSSVKVTKGIISSLTGVGNNFSEMQIDAALQSGNSGGPILDEQGNVVGVAVAKLDLQSRWKISVLSWRTPISASSPVSLAGFLTAMVSPPICQQQRDVENRSRGDEIEGHLVALLLDDHGAD